MQELEFVKLRVLDGLGVEEGLLDQMSWVV